MVFALQSQPNSQANPYGGPDQSELPATEKQIRFARRIALTGGIVLPWEAQVSRRSLSQWIDANAAVLNSPSEFSQYASSKQVAFAERIARIKRRQVPHECFKDRQLMSRWIDSNK
ncbi:hypothetical protein SAMN05444273_1114 [Litoreibacter ascidiaceicola]|uniref:Uncharacterized protein n=1 Tax=Litoreibacter ascidiaceicola TaxID=1486859 RepID=A0A1M5E377_9RHOB|nr:hypothetical protein [Litoreibacter ascidiaceicola]SHF73620.1 hypothetical protein SAMN05444273_1114 [Litoreibacter ascidiaceicola]